MRPHSIRLEASFRTPKLLESCHSCDTQDASVQLRSSARFNGLSLPSGVAAFTPLEQRSEVFGTRLAESYRQVLTSADLLRKGAPVTFLIFRKSHR